MVLAKVFCPFKLCLLIFIATAVPCQSGPSWANGPHSGSKQLSDINNTALNTNTYGNKSVPPVFAIWANSGEDKVTKDELRASRNGPRSVLNSFWDGTAVKVKGARNEVVAFNLVIESPNEPLTDVTVQFNLLTGNKGDIIKSNGSTRDDIYKWSSRPIELFLVRYLQIKGLSRLSYETYDERHIPQRFRRPLSRLGSFMGRARGLWTDRPDHDKFYPDIAVPIEAVGKFRIAPKTNQSIWVDIYIPKDALSDKYSGSIIIKSQTTVLAQIPVELLVRPFTLPDHNHSKTMVFLGYENIIKRYLGKTYVNPNTGDDTLVNRIRDNHFLLAHRHRVSLIDSNAGASVFNNSKPRPEWIKRLDGSLFTSSHNYDGPGVGVGNDVFSIGTYGSWPWSRTDKAEQARRIQEWSQWFQQHSPNTETFLYLIDESKEYEKINEWAKVAESVSPPLSTLATLPLPDGVKFATSLSIFASWFTVGDTKLWSDAYKKAKSMTPTRKVYAYNGKRPATGSFAIEDDGVALRQLSWAQYKMGIDRWFFWESTYYNDYQNGRGDINVFAQAQTFGAPAQTDPILGETSGQYANGDGILFYPGTDMVFKDDSYYLPGPIASLRLKHWRRGIQDIEYLELARQKNKTKVIDIINNMVPKALWEYGVTDAKDPTWVRSDISWSNSPETWNNALEQLSLIIEGR
jgi:hypothetical protein